MTEDDGDEISALPGNFIDEISVDFRFIAIDEELWTLSAYLNILEDSLPGLVEAGKRHLAEHVAGEDDDVAGSFIALFEADSMKVSRPGFLGPRW